MTIVKQMDIRDNIKKYFDMAHEGEPIIVPRKNDKNVVIISENDYREFEKYKRADKTDCYSSKCCIF